MAISSKFFHFLKKPKTKAYPNTGLIEPEFSKVTENGETFIKKTGEFDYQEYLNIPREESEVYTAINKFVAGDVSVLENARGFYGDVRNFPKTLHEAQNLSIKARNDFDSLPLEIRQKFNNNVDYFVAQLDSSSTREIFEKYLDDHKPVEFVPLKKESDNV